MDLDKLLNKASDGLSVGRAFGPPIERDGVLVIPVAWVAGGGGGGAEEAGAEDKAGGDDAPRSASRPGGSGGGFGGVTWPLGVYVVKEGSVRWVPAVDATRVVLAGLGIARAVIKLMGHPH